MWTLLALCLKLMVHDVASVQNRRYCLSSWLLRSIKKVADVSKMKPDDALPNRSFYPLSAAAAFVGCTALDLVHYAVQDRISLLTGVPDWVSVRVYDETAKELQDPFLLTPQLLGLSPAQCLKIEMQGRTRQSDFKFGYSLESDGALKKLLPSYGRHELKHAWVFWRVFQSGEVCLLDLGLDQLFVTRADLLTLMGEGRETQASQTTVRTEKMVRKTSGDRAAAQDAGSGGGHPTKSVDQVDVIESAPVAGERTKSAAAAAKKSDEPVERAPKPNFQGPTILRLKQVMERTGLSRSTIYDRMSPNSPRHDPTFPTQISLGGDAVGWVDTEIDAWLQRRIAADRS